MEDKVLRVNFDKTKILVCRAKPVQSGKPSGKWPCGVCGKGVFAQPKLNSLHSVCEMDSIKDVSGVKGSLESCKNFKCGKCLNVVASVKMSDSKAASTTVGLESVDTFCYLGDMLSAGDGVEEGRFRCRVRCAWGKFNELMPILKMRGTSLKVKGRKILQSLLVQSVMMYGSETWAMKVEDKQKLKGTEDRGEYDAADVWRLSKKEASVK